MIAGAMFDVATMPFVFDTGVYWLFRYAYLHDIDFFNNRLDTDSDPVAYSNFPGRYAVRMAGVQADIIIPQLSNHEADLRDRIAKARIYDQGWPIYRKSFARRCARMARIPISTTRSK